MSKNILNHKSRDGSRESGAGRFRPWSCDFCNRICYGGSSPHGLDIRAKALEVSNHGNNFAVRWRIGDRADREINHDFSLLRFDALGCAGNLLILVGHADSAQRSHAVADYGGVELL